MALKLISRIDHVHHLIAACLILVSTCEYIERRSSSHECSTLWSLFYILWIGGIRYKQQQQAAHETAGFFLFPLPSPSSLIGNYQEDYYQVMNMFNNTVSLFKRQVCFYLIIVKKASKLWNFNKDGKFGWNMYHITHILNFQLSILLGSLSPFTLNLNQIVFFSSHIPRTKDLWFSRISFENTRGKILNWITMDIFVPQLKG